MVLVLLWIIHSNSMAQFDGAGLYECTAVKYIWAEPKTYAGNTTYAHFDKGDVVELSLTMVFEEYDGKEIVWCRIKNDDRWITDRNLKPLEFEETSATHKNNSSTIGETIECNQPPPILELVQESLKLNETNGNTFIDASERAEIHFSLRNIGPGPSQFPKVNAIGANRSAYGIWVEENVEPRQVKPNDLEEFVVFLMSDENTKTGSITLQIEVVDGCGFGILPFDITLPTRSFLEPDVRVVDALSIPALWTRGTPIQLKVLLQNIGVGVAEDVRASLQLPPGIICYSGNDDSSLGELQSGETRELVFDILVPKTVASEEIETKLSITEKHNKYAQSWTRLDNIGILPSKELFTFERSVEIDNTEPQIGAIGRLGNRGHVEFNSNPKDVIVERVAVVAAQGMDCGGVIRPGQDLASYVEGSLLGYYEVVERRNLERVLDEQKLALSGIMFEKSTVEAGCNIGAQGIIFTEFGCIGGQETIQVKLVDCQTSELYWSATGHGSSILDVVKEIKVNLDE